MGSKSTIEWTAGDDGALGATWNPTRGCSRITPGCENCYAEQIAGRFSGPGLPYEGLVRRGPNGARWLNVLRLVPDALTLPLRWRKPRRVFVNSMSDLFHEKLTNEEIASVFGVMAACPQHSFQVLTKRADRMREFFSWLHVDGHGRHLAPALVEHAAARVRRLGDAKSAEWLQRISNTMPWAVLSAWPLRNVWLGVSVEDQQRADERIPQLLRTPAAVRFVSAEPLLSGVDLSPWLAADTLRCDGCSPEGELCDGHVRRHALDWVIVGGESGRGARPFDLAWALSLVAQCKGADVAVFVKQLGSKAEERGRYENGEFDGKHFFLDLAHPKGGDPAEWPENLRVREFPRPPGPTTPRPAGAPRPLETGAP